MRSPVLACLSLASLVLGAPSMRRAQDAVTPELLDDLKLFAQWSSAASCNTEKAFGEPVTCNENQCSMFSSHNATVVASFIGTVLDTRGFVGVDTVSQQIVVSFRGTTSVRNWIADFTFIQVPCDLTPGCLAHAGFYASWAEVAARALAAVGTARAAHPGYRVVVTGHSLGGAVATLAAASLRKAGHAADLYTYGSPRVGNLAFAAFVTGQAGGEYRVTHADDPVPRLPPVLFNYRHTSPEYWIEVQGGGADGAVTAANEIRVCPGYANLDCNGGTLGLDLDAHTWYFQRLRGCSAGSGTPLRRTAEEMTDEELEARLNLYVELDKQLVENLHAEGQT